MTISSFLNYPVQAIRSYFTAPPVQKKPKVLGHDPIDTIAPYQHNPWATLQPKTVTPQYLDIPASVSAITPKLCVTSSPHTASASIEQEVAQAYKRARMMASFSTTYFLENAKILRELNKKEEIDHQNDQLNKETIYNRKIVIVDNVAKGVALGLGIVAAVAAIVGTGGVAAFALVPAVAAGTANLYSGGTKLVTRLSAERLNQINGELTVHRQVNEINKTALSGALQAASAETKREFKMWEALGSLQRNFNESINSIFAY